MANLYGVSNPLPLPFFATIPSNVSCPAGAETQVTSGQIAALSAGFYYPVVWGLLGLSLGATAPFPLTINGRVNGGADFANLQVGATFLTASANLIYFFALAGTPSSTIWQGAGANVQISVTPTGQAITVLASGSYAQIFLFRAPDQ